MKRTANRKLRLSYHLKAIKNNGELLSINLRVKTRLFDFIEASSFKKWYIKITYYPDVFNHGSFEKKEDLKIFINQCTEKPLLDYIEKGAW